METSEFTEFDGNFEILNFTLQMLEIRGQKRAVLRPLAFGGSLKECRLTGISTHSAPQAQQENHFCYLQMKNVSNTVYITPTHA